MPQSLESIPTLIANEAHAFLLPVLVRMFDGDREYEPFRGSPDQVFGPKGQLQREFERAPIPVRGFQVLFAEIEDLAAADSDSFD